MSAKGQSFNKTSTSASVEQKQAVDRPLVNYVWINSKPKAVVDLDNPVCAIEMANIQRALDNADKYPEADFQIWVDKKLLDDYSLFCLDCFVRDNASQDNVTIHDLQEIPDYAGDDYFKPLKPTDEKYLLDQFNSRSGTRNIYSRADLARILVLDHCMETCPERKRIIYTDMDCPDIRLPEALPLMNQYGVALNDMGFRAASNGYIGLAADNINVKQHFKDLKSFAQDDAYHDILGHNAFDDFLTALGMPTYKWHTKIGLPDLLPPMRERPKPLLYTPPSAELAAWKSAHQPPASRAMAPQTAS